LGGSPLTTMNKTQLALIERRRIKNAEKRGIELVSVEKPVSNIHLFYHPEKAKDIKTIMNRWYVKSNRAISGAYFLTFVGDEFKIKIGKGKCLDTRTRSYLTHSPRDIKVLCWVHTKTGLEGFLEQEFHNYFYQDKYDREWFNPSEFLLNSIEEIKKINKFEPFTITRKGPDLYDDLNYIQNQMRSYL
tara:strand:- start:40 stop:603 length:564 start_codon:yes stop_codon:yes gene_type:complete